MPPQQNDVVDSNVVPTEILSVAILSSEHDVVNNDVQKSDSAAFAVNDDEKAENKEKDDEKNIRYEVGDHVYKWMSYMGVPYATQQHGIVVNTEPGCVTLILFQKKSHENVGEAKEKEDVSRIFCMVEENVSLEEAQQNWHQIPYGVHWTKRLLSRAGTANPVESDDVNIVLTRVGFLWNHQNNLLVDLAKETTPEKDISECIVVWCKTGNFYSYHGLAKMGHHGADVGSSATLAGGICTQLVAGSAVPFLLPVFAVYDVAVAVKTWRDTHACQKEWNVITRKWNEKFVIAIASELRESRRESSVASFLPSPSQQPFSNFD